MVLPYKTITSNYYDKEIIIFIYRSKEIDYYIKMSEEQEYKTITITVKKRGTRREDETHNQYVKRRAKERYENDPEFVAMSKLKYYKKKFPNDEIYQSILTQDKPYTIKLEQVKQYIKHKKLIHNLEHVKSS